MKLRETTECPNCKRLAGRVAKLEEQLAAALQRISELEQQLAAARKDSSTSSKPPSSDIVKPKKPRGKGGKKRKRGGQPGHKRHQRPEFPPEMIGKFFSYTLDSCPDCGGELLFSRKAHPRVVQQAELIDRPLRITEHEAPAYEELLARLPGEAFLNVDETGRRWCERIWTTIATCAQQGRSVFEFLLASVESHLRGAPPPSLMPSGP